VLRPAGRLRVKFIYFFPNLQARKFHFFESWLPLLKLQQTLKPCPGREELAGVNSSHSPSPGDYFTAEREPERSAECQENISISPCPFTQGCVSVCAARAPQPPPVTYGQPYWCTHSALVPMAVGDGSLGTDAAQARKKKSCIYY